MGVRGRVFLRLLSAERTFPESDRRRASSPPLFFGIASGKITYHVLEAQDPGAAIIEFARSNNVDQIVIGSRGSSTFRRYLGSVSSQVVAQAPCTVTVVKAGGRSGPGEGEA